VKPNSSNPALINWPSDFKLGDSGADPANWIKPGTVCLALFNNSATIVPFLALGIHQSTASTFFELDAASDLDQSVSAETILYGLSLVQAPNKPPPATIAINLGTLNNLLPTFHPAKKAELASRATTILAPKPSATAPIQTYKLLPCPLDWIEDLIDHPWNPVDLYRKLNETDFDDTALGRDSPATFFLNWARCAATATTTTIDATSVSALAINATIWPLDQAGTHIHKTACDFMVSQMELWHPPLGEHLDVALTPADLADARRRLNALDENFLRRRPEQNTDTTTTANMLAETARLISGFFQPMIEHQQTSTTTMAALAQQLLDHQATKLSLATDRISLPVKYNLLGWCGLQPDDDLPEIWIHFNASKKSDTPDFLTNDLWSTLKTIEPTFDDSILNHTLVTTIVHFRFAPQQKHLGLGPLVAAFRPQSDITTLEQQFLLQQDATSTTTQDMKRLQLRTPPPPADVASLTLLLHRWSCLLHALFGAACPLYTQLALIKQVLSEQNGYYTENARAFRFYVAPAILNELTKASNTFFTRRTSQTDVAQGLLPQVDLSRLYENIGRKHHFQDHGDIAQMYCSEDVWTARLQAQRHQFPSVMLPPLPLHPAGRPPQLQHGPDNISVLTSNTFGTRGTGPTNATRYGTNSTASSSQRPRIDPIDNPALDPKLRAALNDWKNRHRSENPSIDHLAMGLNTTKNDLITQANLTPTDCQRWALLGRCPGGERCQNRAHTTQIPSALAAALASCLETLPPEKRARSS
jgi:hypothetical protein